jgi:hypothetical protein
MNFSFNWTQNIIENIRIRTEKHLKAKKSHLRPILPAQNEWRLCAVYCHFLSLFEGFLGILREVLKLIITILA